MVRDDECAVAARLVDEGVRGRENDGDGSEAPAPCTQMKCNLVGGWDCEADTGEEGREPRACSPGHELHCCNRR